MEEKTPPAFSLRSVSMSDIQALQNLSRKTFAETFASDNSEENMVKYLEEAFSIEKLSEELENPDSIFYFAIVDKNPVGYLKVNKADAQTELKENKSVEIERIYVLREYHGKEVGKKLCDKAIELSIAEGAEYVWLGVWERNTRAIRFYEKNGFTPFDKHIFKLGDEDQTDILMKRILD
ncbi:MAG: GNAT family N-acetyltransferase [Bacteroidota bacterium]